MILVQQPRRPPNFHGPQRAKDTDIQETDTESDEEEKIDLKKYAISLLRDILIAVIIMAIIIGSLWGYTGNWPPMVVIESNSMMHGSDSNVGTIDTGDLVLVKAINKQSDITPYVDGKSSNYKTYNSYGDVIIFKKNGLDDTPVIHRAVVYIEYNASGDNSVKDCQDLGSFDVPSLSLYNVMEFHIPDYIPGHINLTINLGPVLSNFQKYQLEPHGGFLTKGDNNGIIDQTNLPDLHGRVVAPIKTDWIVGKAEGELPWFGLIKLYISGDTNVPEKRPPQTSVNMLILSITLIIVIPIILDLSFSYISKRMKKKREEEEAERDDRSDLPHAPRGIHSIKGTVPYRTPQANNTGPPQPQRGQPGPNKFQQPPTSKDELLRKIK